MAEEIKKIISVDVTGAVSSLSEMKEETESAGYSFKSLGDAKKYIDKLKASLIDLDKDSDEYANTLIEINKVQTKLNEVMKASGDTAKSAEGSYNALSKQMSELKKAWKETSDEAERESIGKQIVVINDKLKSFDASIGNYQRNVGNYESAFTKGIGEITNKITSLSNPLAIAKSGVMALGNAFKALIANPIGAVITAIVLAIQALKKGFDKSEEATNKLKKAFSALEPITNLISRAFTGFANIIGTIAEKAIPALVSGIQTASAWLMELLNKVGVVSDETLNNFKASIESQKEAVKTTQELTEREIELTKRKRDLQVEQAKMELEVSELRAKAADKEKYSATERQKYLESAIAIERKMNQDQLSIAQEEYDIALKRSQLTDNDAATNERLAELQANLYRVKKDYYDKERKLIANLNEAKKSQTTTVKTENKKQVDEEAKKLAELERIREEELSKINDIQERSRQSLLDDSERELEILTKKYEDEKSLLEKYGEDTINLTQEYNNKVAEIKAGDVESKLTGVDEEAELQKYLAEIEIQNEWDKRERILEIERQKLEDKKLIYEELLAMDNLDVETKQEYANKLAEINASIAENANQTKEVQLQKTQEIIDQYTQLASSIGNLMEGIAAFWQNDIKQRQKNGKLSEEEAKKEFERTKKVQIAGAIVTGLAGIAAVLASPSLMSMGIPGIILAATQAASIAISTATQIAKIKSTSYDSGGSGGSSVSASSTPTQTATQYTPNYSTNITGASETTNLANAVRSGSSDTRVYVLESDISDAGKKVQVRESEATF